MSKLEALRTRAKRLNKTIALSEGSDARVIEAARVAVTEGLANIILVAPSEYYEEVSSKLSDIASAGLQIITPETYPEFDRLAEQLHELRGHKGMTLERAQQELLKPDIFTAMLVNAGLADGCVGGAVYSSAQIIRTAIQIIGKAEDAELVSSFFLMAMNADHHQRKGVFVFSDAGMVADPDARELSQIAMASAKSYSELIGETPKVAMLSFSTKGSASSPSVSKVQEATEILKQTAPDLDVDGEMQFDAAFVPEVGKSKAPGSSVAGNANIFIFPNLDAGNISYKIAQRVGGAIAIGPILQGLAKPANDLSRGCSSEDIVQMIAVTAVQASAATIELEKAKAS